jgi:hypothetical protein
MVATRSRTMVGALNLLKLADQGFGDVALIRLSLIASHNSHLTGHQRLGMGQRLPSLPISRSSTDRRFIWVDCPVDSGPWIEVLTVYQAIMGDTISFLYGFEHTFAVDSDIVHVARNFAFCGRGILRFQQPLNQILTGDVAILAICAGEHGGEKVVGANAA